MSHTIIRNAKYSDANGIINAHRRSIREVCSADYTAEQVKAWSGSDFNPELWCDTMDKDTVQVIDLNSAIQGFGHYGLNDENQFEIKGLYLAPEAIGLGLGSQLVSNAIHQAVAMKSKQIVLHSTVTARKFYEHKGFQYVSDQLLSISGLDILCHKMIRPLNESG